MIHVTCHGGKYSQSHTWVELKIWKSFKCISHLGVELKVFLRIYQKAQIPLHPSAADAHALPGQLNHALCEATMLSWSPGIPFWLILLILWGQSDIPFMDSSLNNQSNEKEMMATGLSATYWFAHWALLRFNEGGERHHCTEEWPTKDMFRHFTVLFLNYCAYFVNWCSVCWCKNLSIPSHNCKHLEGNLLSITHLCEHNSVSSSLVGFIKQTSHWI